jgi:hypothetical protein
MRCPYKPIAVWVTEVRCGEKQRPLYEQSARHAATPPTAKAKKAKCGRGVFFAMDRKRAKVSHFTGRAISALPGSRRPAPASAERKRIPCTPGGAFADNYRFLL